MKIVIINKEILQNRPPVLSTLLSLSDSGYDVSLVSVGINDYWKKELDTREVKYFIVPDREKRNLVSKLFEYRNFKKKAFDFLEKLDVDRENILLWVIGGNTIYCLGEDVKRYRYILQIQELHEDNKRFKNTFNKILNDADAVFVNEYNRAVLYQCWYRLTKRPFIIPNKPYFINADINYDLLPFIDSSLLDRIKNSKVILFQGQIVSYRDLTPYILAAKELGCYQVVLLGNEYGMVEKYRQIDDSLIYLKRIPAPQYLGITALSHICLITYDPHSLNNAYCAPNKIFEYGAYGKPMIGNDIPGLRVLKEYHAGIIVAEEDVESIKAALIEVENNYAYFSEGAKCLYKSVDNKALISKVINSIDKS